MVTDVFVETFPATMVNAALVWLAATVTLLGTLAAAALLLVRATCAPPAGAAASNVTVADLDVPDEIVAAETLTDCTARALVVPELLVPVEPELLFDEPVFEAPVVVPLFAEVLETPGDAVNELGGAPAQLERINKDGRIAPQIPSEGRRIGSTPFK